MRGLNLQQTHTLNSMYIEETLINNKLMCVAIFLYLVRVNKADVELLVFCSMLYFVSISM